MLNAPITLESLLMFLLSPKSIYSSSLVTSLKSWVYWKSKSDVTFFPLIYNSLSTYSTVSLGRPITLLIRVSLSYFAVTMSNLFNPLVLSPFCLQ